jgi:hypothetical protein
MNKRRAPTAAGTRRAKAAKPVQGEPPLELISRLVPLKPGTMAHLESWIGTVPVKEDPLPETLLAEITRRLETSAPPVEEQKLELPVPELQDPSAVQRNQDFVKDRWKKGFSIDVSDPNFNITDYFSPDQMYKMDSQKKTEALMRRVRETVEKIAKSDDPKVVQNRDSKVIMLLVAQGAVGPVMFAVYRTVVDGVPLEMLTEECLTLLHNNDRMWRDYMIELLGKLKANPQDLTPEEKDDIRFGKGNTNRFTQAGRAARSGRMAGDIIFQENGEVRWLQAGDQPPRPARSETRPPAPRPSATRPRATPAAKSDAAPSGTTGGVTSGASQVASLIVVPTRPNSCHAEVKLYGRFMKNPLTEITSAAMFKNTIYFKPTVEQPSQTDEEKKAGLLPAARAQNNLRLPALCQTSASYPRPQISDPRANRTSAYFMVTPPEKCIGMLATSGNQANAVSLVTKAFALLRFEVESVESSNNDPITGDFVANVQAGATEIYSTWKSNNPGLEDLGPPLAMPWISGRALVVQWFDSPEHAADMIQTAAAVTSPLGLYDNAISGSQDKWAGHILKTISATAVKLVLPACDPTNKWDITQGPRILHAPIYAEDLHGNHDPDDDRDLPFVGYNLQYVSDDGFPNSPKDYTPSGCYVDGKGEVYAFQTAGYRGDMLRYQGSTYRAIETTYSVPTGKFLEEVTETDCGVGTGGDKGVLWWTENKMPTSHNFGIDPDWIKEGKGIYADMFPPHPTEKPFLFDLHVLQRAVWEAGNTPEQRGRYGAPTLHEPPPGLSELQKIVWFARQIVYHIKLWVREYDLWKLQPKGEQRREKMMQLRARPRFDFMRSPAKDWSSGSRDWKVLKVVIDLELKRRQRVLRNATLCPRTPAFCSYELPERSVVDSSQVLYRRWGNDDVRRQIPADLERTSLVRRVVHFDPIEETLRDAVRAAGGGGHMRPLGEAVPELQHKEDAPMNTVNNYQHHDAMQTGHSSIVVCEAQDSTSLPGWMKKAKPTLGEAVQEYIDNHYGLFYYTTSLMHEARVDLGLPERLLDEQDEVVHSQVALRPLGINGMTRAPLDGAGTAGESDIKRTAHLLKPRSVRTDLEDSKEPSIGPGSLKVVVRFDTSGKVGFGGADSFLGFVSAEDAFASVRRVEPGYSGTSEPETYQPGSARFYALGDPTTDGTYSNIKIAQMRKEVRSLETMWTSAPHWWKTSAAESDNHDTKFLPIDEVCEPASGTKERSFLFRRFRESSGALALPELPLADANPDAFDGAEDVYALPALAAIQTTDVKRPGEDARPSAPPKVPKAAKVVPGKTKAEEEVPGASRPSKARRVGTGEVDSAFVMYPPRSNPSNLTGEGSSGVAYWSALYVTIFDYDDFTIAAAACDDAFATLMHANPHWYHFKDSYELRRGEIVERVSWEPWVPSSGVDGDTCSLKPHLPLDQEDGDLPSYFPLLDAYPTRDVAGQHMWYDGCSERVPGDLGKFAQRPVGRFWNSWMHDRARFGTSDETARALEGEVKQFQAAFERFSRAQQREEQTGALEDVVNEQTARQLDDSRFVTWMELLLRHSDLSPTPFAGASLVYALEEVGVRLERIRRTLHAFEEHRQAFTDAQRAELLQRGFQSLHCVSRAPDGEFNRLADGLYSRTPSLQAAVETVLAGFCAQPVISMRDFVEDHLEENRLDEDLLDEDLLKQYYGFNEGAQGWVQSWETAVRKLLPNCESYDLAPLPVLVTVPRNNDDLAPLPVLVTVPRSNDDLDGPAEPPEPALAPGETVGRVRVLFIPTAVRDHLRDSVRILAATNRNGAMDTLKTFATRMETLKTFATKLETPWQGGFAHQVAAVRDVAKCLRDELKSGDLREVSALAETKSQNDALPLVRDLASRLSRDSLLAAMQRDVAVTRPVIGGLVLDSVDAEQERDRRAKVVMSVIRIADPFLRETLLLQRLLETGLQDEDQDKVAGCLPEGTDASKGYSNGLYRSPPAIGPDADGLDSYVEHLVENQIKLMESGLDYLQTDINESVPALRKKAMAINKWWADEIVFSPAQEAGRRADPREDTLRADNYDWGDDLGLWGHEPKLSKGATDYELLRGNYHDGKLNYLTEEFNGGEVYGPKGAYVRYVYDMVRPLFGKNRNRLEEHLANGRRTMDLAELPKFASKDADGISVGADGFPLPPVPAVLPDPYNKFRRVTLARYRYLDLGPEQLPHPGEAGNQGTVALRSQFVASADLRHPMQAESREHDLSAPAPELPNAAELLPTPQFVAAYRDYLDYERREVEHAATEEQRAQLERDFASRSKMEFPKGCVPHLGVLHSEPRFSVKTSAD